MDTTQIVIAVISAITTISLAYIAARYAVTKKNQKGNRDIQNNTKDRKP